MAKDFAKSQSKKKPVAKKKPARKTGAVKKKPAKATGPSAGLLFGSGFACGFFAAFLVYLAVLAPGQISDKSAGPAEPPETSKKAEEKTGPKKIDFEFYQMLQDQEVEVESTTTPEERQAEQQDYIYMLQVASFRNLQDADRLKASLILEHGMTVNIRTTNGDTGTWHKVIAGPFDTRSKAASARSVLAQKGFDSLEFKRPVEKSE